MKKFIVLLVLCLIALLAVELWVALEVMHLVQDILGPVIALLILSVIGIKVIGVHVRNIPTAFLSGSIGTRLIGLVGGLLLALPGFITAIIGAILQIPVVQRMFSRVGQIFAGALTKRLFSGGLGPLSGLGGFGGLGGKAGGFPGGFAGGFPGGFPGGLTPDDRVRGSGPKTYDTTVERDADRLK